MSVADDVQISKSLSWLLRHAAENEGLIITADGFICVDDILQHRKFKHKYALNDIIRVVENNDKQRFELKTDERGIYYIRANQGHSLKVVTDLTLEPITDANSFPLVIHGTFYRNWRSIKSSGLNRMKRLHIHFSSGLPSDNHVVSGARSDCQVYIYVNLCKALADGLKFFVSLNGVILSPGNEQGVIETKYFLKVVDSKTGEV